MDFLGLFAMELPEGIHQRSRAGFGPIAHASADCKSPAHQSVWGIFEVFLDTIVVCTLTALVLLTAQGGVLWQRAWMASN